MALFTRSKKQEMSLRGTLERRYAVARRDIMIFIGFTLLNLFLLLTKSNKFFLFSAYIPYMLVDLGMFLCGMHPEEVYEAHYEAPYHTIDFPSKGILYLLVLAAAVVLVWYLISWLRTKKAISAGWLIFTLIYLGIDTVAKLLGEAPLSYGDIFDCVFRLWMIGSLISGIIAARDLKDLPEGSTEEI